MRLLNGRAEDEKTYRILKFNFILKWETKREAMWFDDLIVKKYFVSSSDRAEGEKLIKIQRDFFANEKLIWKTSALKVVNLAK